MSYPPPPPPGQGGPPGPNPYQPNPYGAGGNPYGQPPKKDNTLWWILGIIAVVVIICCIGVCGFFGWVASTADDVTDSYSSSYSGSQASDADEVNEGSQATDNGATLRSGWSVSSSGDLQGVSLRNDGSSRDMLRVKFFFMEDGEVLDDATCSTKFLDPGETDFSPSCLDAFDDIDGYDEIRFTEGT